MQYRDFKGEDVSLLGFGLMRLPVTGGKPGDIDIQAATRLIDSAIERGVNYFDSAYIYHDGTSEPFAGRALTRHPRSSYNIATKMPTWMIEKQEDIRRIFDEQLERCRVDHFDFYLAHNYCVDHFNKLEPMGLYDFLKEKQREGKIRHLGLSVHDSPKGLKTVLAAREWDFVQLQINYLDWDMLNMKEQFAVAEELGVPVIVMEPVRGGALVNLSGDAEKAMHDARPQDSIASWAFRFCASLPNIVTILSGMGSMEQLDDNIKTLSHPAEFTTADREVVSKAVSALLAQGMIPCTGCNYCMPCPAGVDIPGIFAQYNDYMNGRSRMAFSNNYAMLGEYRQAHNCTACGVCMQKCPQGIDIPAGMEKAAACAKEVLGV